MIAKGKVRVTDGCESETLDLPEGVDPEEVCQEWLDADDTRPEEDMDGWTATITIWGTWETCDDEGKTSIERDPKQPPCDDGKNHSWLVEWVQSRGPTIITMEHCTHCGLKRRSSTNEQSEIGTYYQSVAFKTSLGVEDEWETDLDDE